MADESTLPDAAVARYGFTAFLDGCLPNAGFNIVHAFDDEGRELEGSPLHLLNRSQLYESLASADTEVTRSSQMDFYRTRFPAFVPFSSYPTWFKDVEAEQQVVPPVNHSVILVGSGDVRASVATLDIGTSATRMAFAARSRRSEVSFSPLALWQSLGAVDDLSEIIVLAPAGTTFLRRQIDRVCALFGNTDAVLGYCDIECDRLGIVSPLFFPAFDYERLLEQGFCAHVFLVRRDILLAVLKDGNPVSLYDVFFAILERERNLKILHLPFPCARLPKLGVPNVSDVLVEAVAAHLDRRGVPAQICSTAQDMSPLPTIRVRRTADSPQPVTLVIPTRDKSDMLRRCVTTARQFAGDIEFRIVVVNNGSQEDATFHLFEELEAEGAVVLDDPRAFNYARLNNDAIAAINSDILCLLNNDVEFRIPGTLTEMYSRLIEPDVGAVGVLMRRSSEVIQHGGVVFGPQAAAAHAFTDHVIGSSGYADALRVAHQTSAVTAACLMIRKADFDAVGGFDAAAFPVAFNDADLCQKLIASGKRIVFTPHVDIVHHESVSRGSDMTALRRPLFGRELGNLRDRWPETIRNDPFYNPYLDRSSHPYSGLACGVTDVSGRLSQVHLTMARK